MDSGLMGPATPSPPQNFWARTAPVDEEGGWRWKFDVSLRSVAYDTGHRCVGSDDNRPTLVSGDVGRCDDAKVTALASPRGRYKTVALLRDDRSQYCSKRQHF